MCGAELSICSLATSFRGQLPELQCLMVDSLKLSQLWVFLARECVAQLANLGLVTITVAFLSWTRQRRLVFRMVKRLAWPKRLSMTSMSCAIDPMPMVKLVLLAT